MCPIIILTSSMAVYAVPVTSATQPGIQPFWSNTSDMGVGFTITDGKAELGAWVECYSGVTKITVVAVLERLNSNGTYTEIEYWDNISSNIRDLLWGSTRYVAKGYTYRLTFTATVYKNGNGEEVSGSKIAKA